jgi:circadian clock protein KaiC
MIVWPRRAFNKKRMTMTTEQNSTTSDFLSTGVAGLDHILGGGLTRDRLYLVEGEPGTGKTTLALQFLLEGAARGETVLYITLSESVVELRAVAVAHGWDTGPIHIHDVVPSESLLDPEQQYTIFHPSEVELGTTTQDIVSAIERLKPSRVVIDSLSELKLLATNSLRYRRQVLAFKQFFASRSCTVLLLDDRASLDGDLQVRSIAHGVISLEQTLNSYGSTRRRVRIIKYRGIPFREGMHDYKIKRGGLVVYPRLVASESRTMFHPTQFSTGLPALDALLGGGLEYGTSTLIAGPPGVGKSSLAAQYVNSATQQDMHAALFLFEESTSNFLNRCDGLGMHLRQSMDNGCLKIQQVDPAELAPGEFADAVCRAADGGARMIVIDSLNGYLNATPDERFLTTHLHELLMYLGQRRVLTILVGVQQGMLGSGMTTAFNVSYLADNVVMLRYFESAGEVRQAISIFKKRNGAHERTIRQFSMAQGRIDVGPVLRQFHGVLTGVPTIIENMLDDADNGSVI